MTGSRFEMYLCEIFNKLGFWALRVARDARGAQPFDVIAIKDSVVYAVDCKVCSRPRFDLSRAECNQKLAFHVLEQKTRAICGFMCLYAGDIYFVPYKMAQECSASSINLKDRNYLWLSKSSICKIMEETDES